ncbi:MAG TPA: glycosyl hydrolase [Pedobacter sp.]|uniref:glycosyl hydrolase n=1 Tax=Pedobacter sp. TaxID=1411316 RepID=UPI002C733151|nr:glycosyl hydrolase [Pedobacter sp.]HMI03259.1 glycosyl hydrolase [Pedobacter sp.]
MNLKHGIGLLFFISLFSACNSARQSLQQKPVNNSSSALQTGFVNPPANIQTSVYWYWMSDNISKQGVIKDLYAMKSVGINRAFIGNIGYETTPYGKVKLFSEEWWDIMHTALKTATELDIEIGIFNSPGWSQSGGPWIKPAQAMRYLKSTERYIEGPIRLSTILDKPAGDFQDVRVIAFKAGKSDGTTIAELKPKLSSNLRTASLDALIDGDQNTSIMTRAEAVNFDLEVDKDFTARSVVVYPAHKRLNAKGEIQVKDGASFRTVKTFNIDRGNDNLNVGFDPYGPVAVSIPTTVGKVFRVLFKDTSRDFGVAELKISAAPVIESFTEKTLAKMYQSPLPYWHEYQWPLQPVVDQEDLVIDPSTVIDISDKMSADGTLNWNVPAGKWVVMRTGMLPTGVKNGPASPEGIGLEVDKMSKEHVASHFDSFLGEIIRRVPAADRKTWKVAVQDSYETGGQNWTDGLIEKFKASYGYDPLPYLPVMDGKVVGSAEQSDRFLWDLRRFIADRVAYDYVGGLREISHKYGLHTWLENYGHWGFPGEFLQYGGQSDEIGGEFWSEGELGNIENRAASSAAHIYGKTKVSAESFTAAGKTYARYPYMMKQRGDRFFTEGINNTLLHVYIQQPTDDIVPGINANFGNEFNRHNTWFSYLDLFTSYLKRTNFMLQQGLYVADVAYFIGEDAPKMTGITDPALPQGYSFDYINAEVIKGRVKVQDGKMVLPDGMSYKLLVLPKLETMRPELLRKIKDLVAQGMHILGPAPKRSPSLAAFPSADAEVQKLAAELWGSVDGLNVKSGKFGKGTVMAGMDMQAALDELQLIPDFHVKDKSPVLYIHRNTSDEEIYFVSNQSEKEIDVTPSFRVVARQPELWDAVTGKMRMLPEYTSNGSATIVPLKLGPLESAFIVFRKPASSIGAGHVNFPAGKIVSTLSSPWEVTFDHDKMRGPKEPVIFKELMDWTRHDDERIKYYSGTAVYKNTFSAIKAVENERLFLELGDVKVMAKVKVNGIDVGGVWTYPWHVDVTSALKNGSNEVEISVVNTWVNRLIGDSKLPVSERKTWSGDNPYKSASPLEPSGLRGPVTIKSLKY